MVKKEDVSKLLWLDMEMTGLDVEKEVPIEVATIITDWKWNALASYHAIIKAPATKLKAMDEWNQKHHKASGLLALIPKGLALKAADKELSSWIIEHFGGERAILAGNSIN